LCIRVVEDEPLNVVVLESALEDAGFMVVTAVDGDEALAKPGPLWRSVLSTCRRAAVSLRRESIGMARQPGRFR